MGEIQEAENLCEIESIRGRSREVLAMGYAISIAPFKRFMKASKSSVPSSDGTRPRPVQEDGTGKSRLAPLPEVRSISHG